MIALTKIRELNLSVAASPGRPLHLSAASGLICLHSFIFVVADDELHLGVFRAADSEPGHLIRLFDGALPDPKTQRKRKKPDLEALALLPAHEDHPHGALLALGSGSTSNRRMGALLGLDAHGAVHGLPRVVDLSPLLAPLDDAFPALNIEGATIDGGELRLFQRGNTRHPVNAIIRFPLPDLFDLLRAERTGAIKPSAIDTIDLGKIDGIPLSITDAAALPDGATVFTAIAEDTNDAYADGPCIGAAIGIVDRFFRLRCLHRLDRPCKLEGVDARIDGDGIRLLLVTDADDPDIPGGLFSTSIER
jgi:hypothetical protein